MTIYQQIIEAGKRATPRPWRRASGRTTEAVVADCRDYDSVEQVRYGGSPVADCDTNPHCGSTERENDDNADYIALAANHADKMAEQITHFLADDNELERAWTAALSLPSDPDGYCTEEGTSGHSLAMRGVAAYTALLTAAEACRKGREEAERERDELRKILEAAEGRL